MDELYREFQQKSSLVRAVASIYDSISASRIASVTLTPDVTMSFQIPPITSTSHLPNSIEPSYPGLWLTSAENLSAEGHDQRDNASYGSLNITANQSALLPLMSENEILGDLDLSNSRSLGPVIAHFLRISKVNKSFAQVAAMSGLSLEVVQLLANHLVYWRRARVIPPLNKQDMYFVSPNADLGRLAKASAAFGAEFPTSPSLPKMLASLSGTPVPYSILIPSRDHKNLYYSMLAWLLRGAWVTQLRTFAWIKVSPEIKKAVQASVMREAMSKTPRSPLDSNDDDGRESTAQQIERLDSGEHSPRSLGGRDYDEESVCSNDSHRSAELPMLSEHSLRFTSMILRPNFASPLESRWIEEIAARFPRQDLSVLPSPSHPHFPSNNDNDNKNQATSILSTTSRHVDHSGDLSTQQSSTTESQQSDQLNDAALLHQTYPEREDDARAVHSPPHDISTYWRIFAHYYNGSESLESIAVREGIKRDIVRRILALIDAGVCHTSIVASESHRPPTLNSTNREKVVVTVRHW